ncbi:MAG: thermonuclease family protein [Geminocystis sp.]|nr:thermonuclease family protein [Geminocystis sp.]HIK37047.1 thermonuclease family protein [Geminocystis sp. M7585_C2015_104]MCS7147295.1 thermonuclease family protein [Geminocystis sp.]MCX8078821.1 thermonuclease family protein [Geminocystis sp.]MDW8116294.1 thermonuclease family protein [Geminocystis sp.]
MTFRLIKGTFHVVGYSPDGDSVRFKAKNPENWNLLAGIPTVLNEENHAQIRLLGIDSLETHFRNFQQQWGFTSANFLLEKLEIEGVKWDEEKKTVVAAKDKNPGFILAKKTDQHGRPLAFVFTGDIDHPDGAEFLLPVGLLFKSANYQSLAWGQSYPTYYRGIAPTLRAKMTGAVVKARNKKIGIWQSDVTNQGFRVWDLFDVSKNIVILPKLFRRLIAYLETSSELSGFKNSIVKSEKVLILPHKKKKLFRDIILQQEDFFCLSELPENLIYL